MKIFWRNIHLWLGLAAGLIFFVECLSGTLLVFEDEITEIAHAKRYFVSYEKRAPLELDKLTAVVKSELPKAKITGVKVYNDPSRTIEISVSSGGGDRKGAKPIPAKGKKGGGKGGKKVVLFLNPYTAEITAKQDPSEKTFFKLMLEVHQTLLAGETGKTILGISTFVVFVILITGVILWFPKKNKQLKARLKIKTDGSWKRINHDLHIVLGFYCTVFIFIFLLTSLCWSFKWANTALYTITGSKPGLPEKPSSVSPAQDKAAISYEQALHSGQEQFKKAPYWTIAMPEDKDGTVTVTSASLDALHRNGFDNISLDQRTGEVLQVTRLKDLPGGWQLRRYMKPIHTGAIGGLPTKFLAFFVCLISASFPITGTILWLNRIRKKKKKNKIAADGL